MQNLTIFALAVPDNYINGGVKI